MSLAKLDIVLLILSLLFLQEAAGLQTASDLFKLKSRIEFPAGLSVGHVLPLDDGRKLLLIAGSEARIWDVEKGALIKSYTNDFSFSPKGLVETLVVSPDGSKLITVEKLSGNKYRSATVWDLSTGKHTELNGTLNKTRSARFSRNGKIILTTHGDLKDLELRFWDAGTLKLRSSIRMKDLGWHHISDTGDRIFIANGKAIKWLNYSVMRYLLRRTSAFLIQRRVRR